MSDNKNDNYDSGSFRDWNSNDDGFKLELNHDAFKGDNSNNHRYRHDDDDDFLNFETNYDDYSIERFPKNERDSLGNILLAQISGFFVMNQFILGLMMGYALSFIDSVITIVLCSIVVQFVGYLLGLAAQREGLTLSMLSQWAGFGKVGSRLVGMVLTLGFCAWIYIQFLLLMEYLTDLPYEPDLKWSIYGFFALVPLFIYIAFHGFNGLVKSNKIVLPIITILAGVMVYNALIKKGIDSAFLSNMHVGLLKTHFYQACVVVTIMDLMIFAFTMPDITRRCKSEEDVYKVSLISTLTGIVFSILGFLFARAFLAFNTESAFNFMGSVAFIFVYCSLLKSLDQSLYSASLSAVTFVKQTFGVASRRSTVTVVLGVACVAALFYTKASIASTLLRNILFSVIPPIASIIIVDYWILKTNRKLLKQKYKKEDLPEPSSKSSIPALAAWIISAVATYFGNWGVVLPLNSLVLAAVLYYLFSIFSKSAK